MVFEKRLLSRLIALLVLPLFLGPAFSIGNVSMSGIVGRDILQIEGAEFPNSPTNEKNIGDNPWVEVHVGVSEAESVTVIERTGTYHTNTYDLATLMGPGGTFSTIADEYYTVTSDGNNLTIHCFRPNLDGGGNNIIATKLNGVPGVPDGIWATGIVDYALGTGGLRETRFNALGNHMQNHTRLGDDHSEIVLGYSYTYEVLPPENLTTRVLGPDIVLEWSPSVSFGIDYYRIYGGHSPRTIDLFESHRVYPTWVLDDLLDSLWWSSRPRTLLSRTGIQCDIWIGELHFKHCRHIQHTI